MTNSFANVPYTVQILAEQARRLGLQIENQPRARPVSSTVQTAARKPRDLGSALEISTIHQRVRNLMKAKNTESGLPQTLPPTVQPLPKGWEERFDPGTNRKFYIDHINRVMFLVTDSCLPTCPLQHLL